MFGVLDNCGDLEGTGRGPEVGAGSGNEIADGLCDGWFIYVKQRVLIYVPVSISCWMEMGRHIEERGFMRHRERLLQC